MSSDFKIFGINLIKHKFYAPRLMECFSWISHALFLSTRSYFTSTLLAFSTGIEPATFALPSSFDGYCQAVPRSLNARFHAQHSNSSCYHRHFMGTSRKFPVHDRNGFTHSTKIYRATIVISSGLLGSTKFITDSCQRVLGCSRQCRALKIFVLPSSFRRDCYAALNS